MGSKIEWTNETWNPTTGCTKISSGCANCYIERTPPMRMAGKKFVNGKIPIELHHDRLDTPLHWKKPGMVFVNSMSDLFHADIPDAFIADVFATMYESQWHTFQVLTKRAQRMAALLADAHFPLTVGRLVFDRMRQNHPDRAGVLTVGEIARDVIYNWPLPNVWLGVSVENQEHADKRIPHLLETPAAVRFLSCEPLLGEINTDKWLTPCCERGDREGHSPCPVCIDNGRKYEPSGINWVIVGGESGPKARPCNLEWVRGVVQQCQEAGVPCFVKQLGSRPITHCGQCGRDIGYGVMGGWVDACGPTHAALIAESKRVNDKKGGDIDEWPNDLRVREFPKAVGRGEFV